jgi:AcrR family transcriptional regulator
MSPARRLSRDEQRARTRRDLLAAAATVFARNGYHATSVDMVAEAAGYTKGAVYSNFASKEELFLALIDEHLDQAVDTLEEIVATADPADRADLLGERREKLQVFDRDWPCSRPSSSSTRHGTSTSASCSRSGSSARASASPRSSSATSATSVPTRRSTSMSSRASSSRRATG